MDCVYISEGNYLWKHNDAVIYLGGFAMKKIQLFLKYLVLMLFLTVWIIIMFFTDYMNSQSVKLILHVCSGVWMCILNLGRKLMYRMQGHILQKKQ